MTGALPLSELISLLGFLNHFGEILGTHPYLTRYLWAAYDANVTEGWAMTDAVSLTSSKAGAAVQWRRAITNTPGTTMMRAWSRRQPPYVLSRGHYLTLPYITLHYLTLPRGNRSQRLFFSHLRLPVSVF